MPNSQEDLNNLLKALFDGPGLRRFVHFLNPELSGDLPSTGTSLSKLVFETVVLLKRHRYLDEVFFERLRTEFSRRTAEIDCVAARFSTREIPTIDVSTPPKTGMPPTQNSKPQSVRKGHKQKRDRLSPIFPKLAQAYQSGELIAFVGAGVSRAAGLPTWGGLVEQASDLAQDYGVSQSTLTEVDDLRKNGKLAEALTELSHALGTPTFIEIVKELLDDKSREVPPLGQALAALAPNLKAVLTTNLDRLLERAFPPSWVEYHRPVANLAREQDFILKLHGTLHDADTWILTRDQYDRAMYADPRHQPIFRALMLRAPMLFVGFGLDDVDLNTVLAEIRVMAQGQPPRHFALVPEPIRQGHRRAMAKAGVTLVGYDNFDGSHTGALRVLEALRMTSTDDVVKVVEEPQLVELSVSNSSISIRSEYHEYELGIDVSLGSRDPGSIRGGRLLIDWPCEV